jgi:hypothetical protein
MNPDKAIRRPYLGPEAVSFFSTLHDDLSGRRCGRIAGCLAFHLPQGLSTRLFGGGFPRCSGGWALFCAFAAKRGPRI